MAADKRFADQPACHNCGRVLYGRFCSNCGQEHIDQPVSDQRLYRDFIIEQLNFDLRIFRTILGLLWPGYVTTEYLAGRKGRFVPPFKTYLYISVAMFTVLAVTGHRQSLMRVIQNRAEREFVDSVTVAELPGQLAPDSATRISGSDTIKVQNIVRDGGTMAGPGPNSIQDSAAMVRIGDSSLPHGPASDSLPDSVAAAIEPDRQIVIAADQSPSWSDSSDTDADADTTGQLYRVGSTIRGGFARLKLSPGVFYQRLFKRTTQGMFVLMPILALLLKLLYLRARRGYIQHLIFSLNFHSFAFLVVIVLQALYFIGGKAVTLVNPAALLLIPAYLVLAMKRCYGQDIVRTVIKFVLLTASYGLIFAAGMAVVIYLTLAAT